jgi:DNA-binding SARP family transcriptional activator/streptogramin lyase
MARLDVKILGPFEFTCDGTPVELAGKQRALVAALALAAGSAVSVDGLIDAIWDERPPASARHLVHVYVSQLRTVVGEDAVATRGAAYALDVDGAAVDAARFQRLLEEARRERSLTRYDEALAEWRGRVLDGAEVGGAAAAIAARHLAEVRLAAIEERNELVLEAGRHAELVPALQRLVADEPLRERLRSQLMLALYRSGRQADALAAYRDTHRYFGHELGVEPSPDLRRLERAILDHDPALAAPPTRTTSRRRPSLVVAIAAVAVVCAATATTGAILATRTGDAHSLTLVAGDVGIIDGASGRVLGTRPAVTSPSVLAIGADAIWIGDGLHKTVAEVGRTSGRLLQKVRLGAPPHALASMGRTLWVADGFDGRLQEIVDGRASTPFLPTPTSTGRTAVAFKDGSLWAASQDGYLVAIDPLTRRVRLRMRIGLSNDIRVDTHGIWIAAATRDAVLNVDPSTGRVRPIPIGGVPSEVETGYGSVWAVTPDIGRVWRIDPTRRAVTASIAVASAPVHVALAGGRLWVSARNDPILVAIDPATNRIVQTVELPEPASAITGDRTWLWVALPRG